MERERGNGNGVINRQKGSVIIIKSRMETAWGGRVKGEDGMGRIREDT